MAQDPINKYDGTEPQATTKVKNGPTVIPLNWDAVENMVGIDMKGLAINQTAGKTLTIDYDSLTLVLNTATPPLIMVDLSPTQIAMNWDDGVQMDGRETGLGTGAGWKYLWVYRDDTNGVTSGLWSAATAIGSVAEPDANFRFGRLVGACYWDGASAFSAFQQYDKEVALIANNQIVTNNRSDSAWSSAVSLAAVVPSFATHVILLGEVATGTGNLLLQTAANSSGHYPQFVMRNNDTNIHTHQGKQMLLTQNIHYWTEETSGTIQADLYINGYSLAI